jgi:DNA-binding NtrC family response regulator
MAFSVYPDVYSVLSDGRRFFASSTSWRPLIGPGMITSVNVLRVNHFEIVEAASGPAGLKEFENSKFDLAIVDIFLQATSGLDVIRTMRERVPDLPIVAISGMTTLDFVPASAGLANVVCLQKPFRPNELVRAIEAAQGYPGRRLPAARLCPQLT